LKISKLDNVAAGLTLAARGLRKEEEQKVDLPCQMVTKMVSL